MSDDPRLHRSNHRRADPQADYFRPPRIPTLVHCIHCHHEYDSSLIVWQDDTDAKGEPDGRWMCPMPDCDGAGFGFDIFPIDPDYEDPDGRSIGSFADFGFDEDDEDDVDEDDDAEYFDAGEHEMFHPMLTFARREGELLDGTPLPPELPDYPPAHGGQSRPVRDTDRYEPIPF